MSVLSFLEPVAADLPWTAGDACGCPDDRCIGYHHDVHEPCGCVDVFLREWLVRVEGEADALWWASDIAGTVMDAADDRLMVLLDGIDPDGASDTDTERVITDAELRVLDADLQERALRREHAAAEALQRRVIDAIYANVGGM